MSNLIQFTQVSKKYNGSAVSALEAVSLSVATGEFVAIMGPSGSGKSTLLNLVAGFDKPSGGLLTVDGSNLSKLSETALAHYRRRKVGMIFQFFNLLPNLTALQNVLIAAQLAGRGNHRARALDLLDRLGVLQHRDQYPAKLSGGERQRVAVARALVNAPPLLLADEPTGALDTENGEHVIDILVDLNRSGQTVVLVTHDPVLASRSAKRVVSLIDGQVVSDRCDGVSHGQATTSETTIRAIQ